jgi:predicted metal-dependent peptidase
VYPRLVLPRWEPDGNARVLFAIDASGSIGGEWLSAFAAVARAGRSRARVEVVSFDTAVYPLDAVAGHIQGGGGTSFQVIEDHVATLSRYPDGVVVMTDGYAERPSVRHPERWLWLLAEHGSDEAVRGIGHIVRVRA